MLVSRYIKLNYYNISKLFFSTSARSQNTAAKTAHIVGVYNKKDQLTLTKFAAKINEESSGGLLRQLNYGGPLKAGKSRIFYGLSDNYPIVSAVGLGDGVKSDPNEERDEVKEGVRSAIAAGYSSLLATTTHLEQVVVDPCSPFASCAAEGASLASFVFDELKMEKSRKKVPIIEAFEQDEDFSTGLIMGAGQNHARRLMEMPANILTPTNFAQQAINTLEPLGVKVFVRTREWAQERKMGGFLGVSQGSPEPPIFLELHYDGKDDVDTQLALVGKGVTFDSGGISLKPPKNMDLMRGDMGGAACTFGTIFIAAKMKMKINIKGFIPLCENMPSGTAIKPGDVIVASNGKSIQVDNTDAEGRLILGDALHYACQHKPHTIIDIATLTGAAVVALGTGASAVFSTPAAPLAQLQQAAHYTGDRVWRLPLWKHYEEQVKDYGYADVHNLGKHGNLAGSSLAAVFLKQFVTCDRWMHIDMASVMEGCGGYLKDGMSGRPTRTLAYLAKILADDK